MNNHTHTDRTHSASYRFTAGAAAAMLGVLGFALAAYPTFAAPVAAAEIVVAQDTTPAQAPLTATPNAAGSLKILTAPRSKVTVKPQLQSKSAKTRSVTTNKNGEAYVKNLSPGVTYTVTSGSDRITAVPEAPVAPATSLRVVTTEIPGQLELRWQHKATRAQGAVSFSITATPVSGPVVGPVVGPAGVPAGVQVASLTAPAVTSETSATSIVLTDLNLDTRYEFSVASHNAFSTGTPTKAVMSRSLRELTGAGTAATPVVEPVRVERAQPAPALAPTPAPSPSRPSTRIIYVCPDGYAEAAGLCQKTQAYTFHTETETRAYTYRTESYDVTVIDPGPVYAADIAQSQGTPCPWGGSLNAEGDLCLLPDTSHTETRTRSVKDAAPAGFTDNGTQWTRDFEVKDAAPTGYTDNGSQWVKVTAKVAREVAA